MQLFRDDTGLEPQTLLYRYVSLEAFLALLETRLTTLTNVNNWDDKWEVILSKVPTIDAEGNPTPPLYSFHQDLFAQCWSLVEESDAMWRIYSPSRTGLRLQTTATKFELIGGTAVGYLGTQWDLCRVPRTAPISRGRWGHSAKYR